MLNLFTPLAGQLAPAKYTPLTTAMLKCQIFKTDEKSLWTAMQYVYAYKFSIEPRCSSLFNIKFMQMNHFHVLLTAVTCKSNSLFVQVRKTTQQAVARSLSIMAYKLAFIAMQAQGAHRLPLSNACMMRMGLPSTVLGDHLGRQAACAIDQIITVQNVSITSAQSQDGGQQWVHNLLQTHAMRRVQCNQHRNWALLVTEQHAAWFSCCINIQGQANVQAEMPVQVWPRLMRSIKCCKL